MKRWIVLAAGLMLAFAASADDSVRFGSRLVVLGDSMGHVLQVAGKPDARVPLQNKYGAGVGERLDYYQDNKTVQIYIQQGVVVDIEEIRS